MQIFVTDPDAHRSANRLMANPKRAFKMITECQQILACCIDHFCLPTQLKKVDGSPYATPLSRLNHPCVQWACQSRANMSWLIDCLHQLYSHYDGDGFKNVPDNLKILLSYRVCYDPHRITFLNFAKADAKKLDFRDEHCTFTAYDKFLKAQGD